MRNNLIKKILIKTLFPYGSIRTILVGPCRGMKVKLTFQSGHSVLRSYESKNQKFLAKKIKKGMTIYDIGASCGQYALFFSRMVGPEGRVASFEPVRSIFEQLQANVDLNNLKWVSCHQLALGDKNGEEEFYFSPSNPTMGKVRGVEPAHHVSGVMENVLVPMQTLDSFSKDMSSLDILKIDTEGSAGIVLRGGIETIKKFSPSLFIELHGPDEQNSVQTCMDRSDYKIFDLKGRRVINLNEEWVSPIWCCRA